MGFVDFLADFALTFFAGDFAGFFFAFLEVKVFFLTAGFLAALFFFLDLVFVAIPWSPVDVTHKRTDARITPVWTKVALPFG
ncbi:MAG: hypothetical protein ACE5G9_11030 [Nitrospinales bacterium]